MADTFSNDLRLRLQESGSNAGTWGDLLNDTITNIASALGQGSEVIPNASTHTITLADGTADEARSLYLKCTGGGQACTVTLGPNTISKVWIIDNATSYTLTFSQGSGANVAIAAGAVKVIATDGAGSGAAVVDTLDGLEGSLSTLAVTGTATMGGLAVDGDGLLYSATNVEMRGNANVRISLGTAGTSGANNNSNWIYGNGTNLRFNNAGGFYSWETLGTERMRLDSLGNVGIGGAPLANNQLLLTDAGTYSQFHMQNSTSGSGASDGFRILMDGVNTTITNHETGYMAFETQNTERMRIDSAGRVGISITPKSGWVTDAVQLGTNLSLSEDANSAYLSANAYNSSTGWKRVNNQLAGYIRMGTNDGIFSFSNAVTGAADSAITWQERFRIDSAGSLLVGKTTTAFGTVGIRLEGPNGKIESTRNSNVVMALNRLSTEGSILEFYKDGSPLGSIDAHGNHMAVNAATGTGKLKVGGVVRYNWDANQFYPEQDNARDLGFPSLRWDDVYSTGGINTSDRNEKQDIEELSDAEQRVAVACKGLMRKFRWKSAVIDKGDDARIHVGIMAQDLQAAFEAEGLDPARYGMWCSNTWTDEETGEEITRMSVRYNELLAFIISAI